MYAIILSDMLMHHIILYYMYLYYDILHSILSYYVLLYCDIISNSFFAEISNIYLLHPFLTTGILKCPKQTNKRHVLEQTMQKAHKSFHYLKASPMPPGPLLWPVVFLDVFSNFSAEFCAGSLVSGCSFDVTCFTIDSDFGSGFFQF